MPRDRGLRRRWTTVPLALKLAGGIAAAGLAAVLVAAALAFFLLDDDGGDGGSTLVVLASPIPFEDGIYCLPERFLCVVKPLEGGEHLVFHTLTTHEHFRSQGCQAQWRPVARPGNEYPEQYLPAGDTGVFREPCGGATFTRTGKRVFGPAERDLDQHPYVERGDRLYIDTGTLIFGSPAQGTGPANVTPVARTTPPPGSSPTPAPHAAVRVVVLEQGTGAPVGNAVVTVSGGTAAVSARTVADGTVEIDADAALISTGPGPDGVFRITVTVEAPSFGRWTALNRLYQPSAQYWVELTADPQTMDWICIPRALQQFHRECDGQPAGPEPSTPAPGPTPNGAP